MTTDRDTDLLASDLHDLVDGITPSSSTVARARARRGIARRQRNRRASIAAGGVVVLVAATVFFTVDRNQKDSQGPIGTTTPSTSTATTTSTTTGRSPTGSPILSTIPPVSELPAARASYSQAFAWGTADDQVAFHTPQGEGVSGGPLAFSAQADANITMLDHSSSRIVRFDHGVSSATHISLASPAVTAAAITAEGFVIVATVGDVAVFGPDGQLRGAWPALSPTAITSLSVVDDFVYSVTDHNTRTPLLREVGGPSTYTRLFNAVPEPTPIIVTTVDNGATGVIHISAGGTRYEITTGFQDVRAVKQLPNGTLVIVAGVPQSDSGHADSSETYVLGRIAPDGHAQYKTVAASMGYLVNGPEFVINSDGLAVMGSTTTGGVTVSYYPFR